MISGAHGLGKTSIVTRLARDAPILGVRYIFANERLVTAFDTTTPSTISDVIRASVTRDERGKDLLLRWNSNPRRDIQQRETVFGTIRIGPTL
jgi:hypothetical protein